MAAEEPKINLASTHADSGVAELLGRDDELNQLYGLIDGIGQRGGALVVRGEAGIFWGAEGTGVAWPADELSLLGVIAFFALVSLVLVRALRRRRVVPVTAGAEA